MHTYPKDLVSNRNISNILEEPPICPRNFEPTKWVKEH